MTRSLKMACLLHVTHRLWSVRGCAPLIIVLLNLSVHADTDSLIKLALSRAQAISTIECKLNRIQTYASVAKKATADYRFRRRKGTVYRYRIPFRFNFIYADSIVTIVDPTDKTGFRATRDSVSHLFFRDLDLVGWFLDGAGGGLFRFEGSRDSTAIFSRAIENTDLVEYLAVNRDSALLRLIEWFAGGFLVRQAFLYYDNGFDRHHPNLPSSMCIKKIVGGEISTDSIYFSKCKINKPLQDSEFSIEKGIRWLGLPQTMQRFGIGQWGGATEK